MRGSEATFSSQLLRWRLASHIWNVSTSSAGSAAGSLSHTHTLLWRSEPKVGQVNTVQLATEHAQTAHCSNTPAARAARVPCMPCQHCTACSAAEASQATFDTQLLGWLVARVLSEVRQHCAS